MRHQRLGVERDVAVVGDLAGGDVGDRDRARGLRLAGEPAIRPEVHDEEHAQEHHAGRGDDADLRARLRASLTRSGSIASAAIGAPGSGSAIGGDSAIWAIGILSC